MNRKGFKWTPPEERLSVVGSSLRSEKQDAPGQSVFSLSKLLAQDVESGKKRKLKSSEEITLALDNLNSKIEELDLESLDVDDEEVLVVDAEIDDLLASCEPESLSLKKPKNDIIMSAPSQSDDNASNIEQKDSGDSECQMKWLRTVGMDHTGQLKCTVSNGSDVNSITGKTESIMADTIKGLVNVYKTKRAEVMDKGIVATPLHVVKKLAQQYQEGIHFETLDFKNGSHRVELFTGSVRGVGEGVTRKIAAQMAAIDLLERVRLSNTPIKVPLYAFLPGWLTNNQVFADLIALCKSKELPRVKLSVRPNTDDDGVIIANKPPWRAECWVGKDLVTIGESEVDILARREAAREMYYLLTNVEYAQSYYSIGKFCTGPSKLAASGYRPVMSDKKKMWLLKHRVALKGMEGPTDDLDLDDVDIEDLENDPDADSASYEFMTKKTLRVTVKAESGMSVASSATSNRHVLMEGPDY